MADLKISQMTAASQAELTDGALFETSVVDGNSSTGYSTRKGLLSQLANYVINTFSGLSLGGTVRTIKAAIDAIKSSVDTNSTNIATNASAISTLNTNLANVGTRRSAYLSASVTVASGSSITNLTNLTLPAGIWVVVAAVSAQSNGATVGSYITAALGSTSTGTQYAQVQVGSSNANTIVQVSAILNYTESTTVYLNMRHAGGVDRTINSGAANTYMIAVRVAGR